MKKYLPLLLFFALAGCIRGLFWQPLPVVEVEDDRSIVFPQFFEHEPVGVGKAGQIYQLDGVLLKAVAIAANDFLPPGKANTACENRQESHSYRTLRQGSIIFVRIDENPEACGQSHGALDSGVRYAISTDGRILRRILDGMEEDVSRPDASAPVPGEPGVSSSFDPDHVPSLPFMFRRTADGGTADGSIPSTPDGSS